jgi:hypothetical protein
MSERWVVITNDMDTTYVEKYDEDVAARIRVAEIQTETDWAVELHTSEVSASADVFLREHMKGGGDGRSRA